jgi:hypothetical protein
MSGRREPSGVTEEGGGTDDGGNDEAERSDRGHREDRSASDGEDTSHSRPTVSSDGAYALLWGVVALLAAALSFDGSVDLVVGLAGFTGAVGGYAVVRDLRHGRPPSTLEFLWMGTPALLGAGVAALGGRYLAAGGLGVVALATLVEGYGWFGAGTDEAGDGGDEAEGSEEPDGRGA